MNRLINMQRFVFLQVYNTYLKISSNLTIIIHDEAVFSLITRIVSDVFLLNNFNVNYY